MSSSSTGTLFRPRLVSPSGRPQDEVPSRSRISSLDIARGLVMVLMAIDHVRVYSGVPAGGPAPAIFFTRWVTHFVAPGFAFFAGTGAYLYGCKIGDRSKLAKFLATRGAFLLLLELTIIRIAWTFNFDFRHYLLAGVIWMLGWCMVLMAGLLWFPVRAILAFGISVICLHNVLDYYMPLIGPKLSESSWAWVAQILYFGGPIPLGQNGPELQVLYSIIPWIGVMACGYAFGRVMELPEAARRRYCVGLGGTAVVLFLILRGFDLYGDPRPWNRAPRRVATALRQRAPSSTSTQSAPATSAKPAQSPSSSPAPSPNTTPAPPRASHPGMNPVLRMLNTAKYPASLSFLLMTLGPLLLFVPLTEHLPRFITGWLRTFGRVPLFYYLLHIPLIHGLALCVSLIRTPSATWWLFMNHPMSPPPPPPGYTWPLALLYVVWGFAIVLLYFPCRWYADLKARSRNKWLSYL